MSAKWSAAKKQARARALGFANYNQYRKANAGEKAARREAIGDRASQKRADSTSSQNAAQRAQAADAVTQLRNGELTSSHLASVLRNAVKRAVTADRRLSAVVTVAIAPSDRNPAGGVRDVKLWQHDAGPGGDHRYSAELFMADIATYGGVKPAFLSHVQRAMERAKYPDKAVAVLHVDLTATD